MNIKLSVHDFFSNTIPGLFYISIVIYFNKMILHNNYPITISNFNIYIVAIILIIAFVLGLIMDRVVNICWWNLFTKSIREKVLQEIKLRYFDLEIKLSVSHYLLYKRYINNNNQEYYEIIDRYDANATLLKDISFSSLLFAIIELIYIFLNGFDIYHFSIFLIAIFFTVISLLEAIKYRKWAIINVFDFVISSNLSFNKLVFKRKKSKQL